MTENKRFKNSLIEFDKAKQKLEDEKRQFKFDVMDFMRDKGIPIEIRFFGDSFGLDINYFDNTWKNAPLKIPRKISLNVLSDFCKEFDCEFEYTTCDGERYIFSFNGMSIGY